ncbi:MAG: B12-binding domain-containing radical SAM protein [Planctomycetes bacterium]|nr:B12-binding domain-containing radical SAM protein [Planctomycetota bacterium]
MAGGGSCWRISGGLGRRGRRAGESTPLRPRGGPETGAEPPSDAVIRYQGDVYRPPSEADSLILQATLGCSYNRCTFCAMYREKDFRVRPLSELREELAWAARSLAGVRKVFLADGDALVAKASFLAELLDEIGRALPGLKRVSCYASPQALAVRTVDEMRDLRERGLTQYYLGIESGHDAVLRDLEKGVDAAEMIRVARKAHAAGVKLSTMILLGAGGRALSREHAVESARVVNAIQPRFLSTLVMTPVPGTPLGAAAARGEVDELDPVELAWELRELLAGLELEGTIFRSNHASNYLTLAGTLPKDKAAMVAALDGVLRAPERAPFRPKWSRGL